MFYPLTSVKLNIMKNATLKQLRVFAAVLRTGSYSGAAQMLNVTPPAVTLQMQLLAAIAGLPLIERAPRGLLPTEAGRALIAAIGRIEAELADCAETLAALSGSSRGHVSVGIVSTAKYFAPRALAAFAGENPEIEVALTIGNREEILSGLRTYDLDVAVMGRPPQEFAVSASVIGDHPHIVIARPDHPLAGQVRAPARYLEEETFLVREPGSGTRLVMERFFKNSEIQPRIGMQIASNETIKQAVIAGLGIALISAHTVEAELGDGRLVPLAIEGLPIIRQWHVVHLKERRIPPAAQALWHFLTEDAERFLPRVPAAIRT